MDTYNSNLCSYTPSKGGYTRIELLVFGMNELKLPFTKLVENYNIKTNKLIILQKMKLCTIINNRFNEINKLYKKNKYIFKNIEKCMLSPNKGGNTIKDLRNIAINQYNIKPHLVADMDKEKLCGKLYNVYLKSLENQIFNLDDDEEDDDNNANDNNANDNNANANNANANNANANNANDNNANDNNANDNNANDNNANNANNNNKSISRKLKRDSPHKKTHKITKNYDKNIKNCKKSPQRGAYSLNVLKKLAVNKYKLNIRGLSKERICDLIEDKLNLYKKYNVESDEIIDLIDKKIVKEKIFE